MDISFENRRILVTGAGRGIGREIVKSLSNKDGRHQIPTIYALSKSQSNLESLKTECPNIQTVCVDLADWEATRIAVTQILPIDGLVNNAAVSRTDPFLEITSETIDKIFNINFKAAVNVSQLVAESMKKTGNGGSIVNISSQASKVALQDHLVYGASKAALDLTTKVMALELGPFNIRVNAVNPTVVLTDMGKETWGPPEMGDPMKAKIPLGRFAEMADVIHPVLFLLSTKSDMIHGITLPVDGGYLAC